MIAELFAEAVLPNLKRNKNVAIAITGISVFSCLVSVFSPSVIPKLILCIVGAGIVFLFRIHVLQVILAAALLHTITPDPYRGLIDIIFAAGIVLALLWIIARISLGHERLQHSLYSDLLIVINVIFVLNGVLSTSLNSMFGSAAAKEIMTPLVYGALLLISYHFVDGMPVVRKIMWTFLAIGIAVATYYGYLAITIGPKAFITYGVTFMHAISGVLSNPGTPAAVITDSIPFLLAYVLYGTNKGKRRLCIAVSIYFLVIWIMSNSRANYVFLFFAFITLLVFHNKRRKYLAIVATGLIAIFVLVSSVPFLQFILRIEKGMSYREGMWVAAYRMIAESPILGKGYGFFYQFKYSYMDPGIARMMVGTAPIISVHNVLLMRGIDLGIGAVLLQIVYWTLPIVIFARKARFVRNSEYYYIYLAIGAILVGMIARAFFDTGTNMPNPILLAAVLRMPELIKPPALETKTL
jgi:O-antigen ligase